MHSSTSPTSPASDLPRPVPARRVIDAPTLVFHWLFAGSFIGAYLTAESEHWRLVHVTLGYTFAGLFVFRVLWGVIGPRHASLGAMVRKLGAWRTALNGLRAARQNWTPSQNLARTAATLTLLLLVIPVTLSGYASHADWPVAWLGQSHEFFSDIQLAVVLGHVGLIAGLSLLRRRNLARPMLTGHASGPGPDLVKRSHRRVAGLLLAGAVGFWLLQWDDAPQPPAAGTLAAEEDDSLMTLLPRVLERVTGFDPELSEHEEPDDD